MIWFPHGDDLKSDASIVRPPFSKASHAAIAAAGFAALLAAPIAIERLFPADPAKIYRGVAPIYGNYYTIGSELAKPGKIDVLIVGASDAWTALDPRVVKARMEAKYGRPMRVLNMGTNWAGEERNAQIVADFVRAHKVDVVLVPESPTIQSQPHELAKFWWRDALRAQELPVRNAAQLHIMSLVGLPRQIWARFQTPKNNPLTESYRAYLEAQTAVLGFNVTRLGFKSHAVADEAQRRPFAERPAPTVTLATDELFYQGEDDPRFAPRSFSYAPFQSAFTRAARDAARQSGAVFATFSIPTHFESSAEERAAIGVLSGVDRDWPTIGISMTNLFPNLAFDEMLDFYLNESHLNEYGARAYTNAMMPAIERLYDEAQSD